MNFQYIPALTQMFQTQKEELHPACFLSNMFRPAAPAEAFLHLKVQCLFKCFLKCFRFGFNDKTEHLQASAIKSPRYNQQMVSFRQENALW